MFGMALRLKTFFDPTKSTKSRRVIHKNVQHTTVAQIKKMRLICFAKARKRPGYELSTKKRDMTKIITKIVINACESKARMLLRNLLMTSAHINVPGNAFFCEQTSHFKQSVKTAGIGCSHLLMVYKCLHVPTSTRFVRRKSSFTWNQSMKSEMVKTKKDIQRAKLCNVNFPMKAG